MVSIAEMLAWLPSRLAARRRLSAALTAASRVAPSDGKSIAFITRRFPTGPGSRRELVTGGDVKMIYLAENFRHDPVSSRLAYLVSSTFPEKFTEVVKSLKDRGIRVIINQNGFYYKGWYGDGWEVRNAVFRKLHSLCDFAVYQSDFCRRAADHFLGKDACRGRVIYNPVDTDSFIPVDHDPDEVRRSPVLLTIAVQENGWYRLKTAIDSAGILAARYPSVKLIVAGYDSARPGHRRLMDRAARTAREVRLSIDNIIFAPPFSRLQAPELFGKAHVLLHPKYNDPSPNLIGESLASGVPIVYSASGGVPELVPPGAGFGIPAPQSWDNLHPPEPESMAEGAISLIDNWGEASKIARTWAIDRLALKHFYLAHEQVFAALRN